MVSATSLRHVIWIVRASTVLFKFRYILTGVQVSPDIPNKTWGSSRFWDTYLLPYPGIIGGIFVTGSGPDYLVGAWLELKRSPTLLRCTVPNKNNMHIIKYSIWRHRPLILQYVQAILVSRAQRLRGIVTSRCRIRVRWRGHYGVKRPKICRPMPVK